MPDQVATPGGELGPRDSSDPPAEVDQPDDLVTWGVIAEPPRPTAVRQAGFANSRRGRRTPPRRNPHAVGRDEELLAARPFRDRTCYPERRTGMSKY